MWEFGTAAEFQLAKPAWDLARKNLTVSPETRNFPSSAGTAHAAYRAYTVPFKEIVLSQPYAGRGTLQVTAKHVAWL